LTGVSGQARIRTVTPGVLTALVFGASFALAAAATPLAARIARRVGLVDRPGGRKAHEGETPLLGGAAVFVALVLPIGGGLAALALDGGARLAFLGAGPEAARERAHALEEAPKALAFLAGAAVMFATGVLDDLRKATFKPAAKLAGQTAAAAILVAGGARIDFLGGTAANAAASVVWVVAVANALNFLDHADGVAAGVALIAAALLGSVAMLEQHYLVALALAALGGGAGGFLVHNFPPARIFLGDGGSLLLGYSLGGLTLLESYLARGSPGLLPVLLPPIVLGLPLFDMAAVVIARAATRRPVYEGDRNHLHHRLVRLGMSTRQATLTVYLAAFALGAGAVALPFVSWGGAVAILAQAVAMMALVAALMFFGEKGQRP
jgi:UDP-GlcNAc:undecaprenyl-phosphate GlcNAc-1-phosphate transferase